MLNSWRHKRHWDISASLGITFPFYMYSLVMRGTFELCTLLSRGAQVPIFEQPDQPASQEDSSCIYQSSIAHTDLHTDRHKHIWADFNVMSWSTAPTSSSDDQSGINFQTISTKGWIFKELLSMPQPHVTLQQKSRTTIKLRYVRWILQYLSQIQHLGDQASCEKPPTRKKCPTWE